MARLDYSAPGVYVEEVDRGSRPIDGVSTSVAGFIGFTEDIRDGAELFKPMLVTTWTQYLRYFAKPNSDGYTDFDAYLPFSVRGYFLNGGGRCWVTSIGTQLPGMKQVEVQEETPPVLEIPRRGNRPSLKLNLLPQQAIEGPVKVEIINGFPRALPPGIDGEEEDTAGNGGNIRSEAPTDTGEFFDIKISRDGEVLEEYEHLSMDPEPQAATYVVEALQSSQYVAIGDIAQPGLPLARRPLNGEYEVQAPIENTSPEQFTKKVEGVRDDRTGVRGIFEIDEITMLSFPDLMRAYETGLIDLEQVHA